MKLKLDENGHVVVQDGKPVYVHDDGKEVAFDAPATVASISRLNGEAKSHRERAEAAEGKLKGFDGIEDPDAARKALDTVKNIDEGKLIAAGKVEEIKAAAKKTAEDQVAAAHRQNAEELAKAQKERDGLQAELHAEKIGGSFTRSKVISERFAIPADLVQARFGSSFRLEDGKVVAYDAAGNKLFSSSRPGEPADFDEAITMLVDQYPHKDQILKGAGASGTGAGGTSGADRGSKATQNTGKFGGTREERTSAIAAKFPDLAKQ